MPENILVSEVGDEAVLLNLNTGHYYGLDDVGAWMWTLLTTSVSAQAAFDACLAEFDVDAVRLRHDLTQLIEQLQSHGLLEVSHG